MSPVTAADYKEVGGSFLGWKFPCSSSFFQVTLMMFLIDLEDDEATSGGSVVLLLTSINLHCPYTISFSLFSLTRQHSPTYLNKLHKTCLPDPKGTLQVIHFLDKFLLW